VNLSRTATNQLDTRKKENQTVTLLNTRPNPLYSISEHKVKILEISIKLSKFSDRYWLVRNWQIMAMRLGITILPLDFSITWQN
jgi:hypothetical protein